MHVLEKLQLQAVEKEKKLKTSYDKFLAKQLIAGAKENTDYSNGKDKTAVEWWIVYNRELENRLS